MQCAQFATDSSADEEMIIAALQHDIGHSWNRKARTVNISA